jgi:hypothetical protein
MFIEIRNRRRKPARRGEGVIVDEAEDCAG